ncbi:heme ABC exporter ATP-binding protein CcmA [Pacificitalea manganoxidans]|uniref:Heme ABC exporter ATP-binding protein CcmA n=1 Tax=Pacificitalea manganoxidans TaxID=1411902 RepID=A0A291M367_9RHOB|nr:heme ABC exporter ATP-binding protein CcmA [Pacificitalea manganoxidans]ATI43350.1 heme ABC exporter ATP-binding protein CcmA [Pacificitalea manganoxidans]MDR6309179.1 heme exporter protein A [Pacificitalea manganoxidans]
MSDPLLQTSDLTCLRGGVPVLEHVTLQLRPGAALILRGPNGAGKTTLLRTLAGLQPPGAGRIDAAPDSLTYAAHADGLKPTLSAAENLTFWAQIHGQRDRTRAGIDAALAALDLTDLRDRLAGQMSAGQKRRLGLARLLVTGRPVWLLDEPTVSLDAASVALFAGVVQAHLATGGAALIATHVELGLEADTLDVSRFRAAPGRLADGFDEAFL